MLCYFQGFHDIVQVLLLVLGKMAAVSAVEHLALLRIRDFMLPTMLPSLAHLHLLPSIIAAADPVLHRHLAGTRPFFALTATLTLYAHEIQGYGAIARLFDFLLAREPLVSIYLFATIIASRRTELLAIPPDDPDMLHFTLSKLPQPLDIDALVQQAAGLVERHPPRSLPYVAWRSISRYSVLKTAQIRPGKPGPTLADGESLFEQQRCQLERHALRQRLAGVLYRYARPAGGVGLAVVVAVLSYWLARGRFDSLLFRAWAFLQHSWVTRLQS